MSSPDDGQPMSAPLFPPPVDRHDLGQGPLIMAITWIFQIFALAAVTARLIVRTQKRASWGWDDYLMLAAVTIQLGLQSLATSSYTSGMGKHDHSLYPEELITILRDNWVSVPPGIVVGLLSRTSISLMLSRIFAPYKWFAYYTLCFAALMWVAGIVEIPLTFLQITPVQALWNFTIVPTGRWDIRIWLYTAYFYQSCCTFSDLTYALFPVIFIWKLNMPLRQKLSLALIMCLSIFSMTMSILKTIALSQIANATVGAPDTQYKSSPQLIYGFTEQSTVIIMGCIPVLHASIKMNFSKLSNLRRYYIFARKSSTSNYASTGYTDLDPNSHEISYVHIAKGNTETSVSAGDYLVSSRSHGRSNDQLLIEDQIIRTDRYTVTYDAKERMQREGV
ncbi:hypothetical protein GQX73_g10468 [Xylaria multiplex]|uniref:Rhodopsin domain-containing protein n=1 Tax=Xylaria multiplex TaxID=323545 RepID=A0A7C8IPC1_9PEZI|nr:hypothetical protein GQX73_g10468 [Xylaria multiplex]